MENLWERVISILKSYGDEPHEIVSVWISQGYGNQGKRLEKSEWYDFFVNQPDGSGYGGEECTAFHLYSKNAILFMGCYDGAEWVESIPRKITKSREVEHVGGG